MDGQSSIRFFNSFSLQSLESRCATCDQNILTDVDPPKLEVYLDAVSSRTYWEPSHFTDMGFPSDFVSSITRDYVSKGGDHKNTIIDHAKVREAIEKGLHPLLELLDPNSTAYTIPNLVAVYDLDFLPKLAEVLGVDGEKISYAYEAHGRGTMARRLCEAIAESLERQPTAIAG